MTQNRDSLKEHNYHFFALKKTIFPRNKLFRELQTINAEVKWQCILICLFFDVSL